MKDPKKGQGADPPALRDRAVGLKAPRGQAVDLLALQVQAVDPLVLQGQSAGLKAPEDQEGAEGTETHVLAAKKAPFD